MIGHDAFRRLDRWLGVPLCAGLSVLRRARRGIRPRAPAAPPAPQRVLFVQLAESGSMVLADPALRALAAHAEVFCATFAPNLGSLAITRSVAARNVFAIRTGSLAQLAVDAARFLLWVRRRRIDAIVDGELFTRATAVLCALTGVRRRVGFHRFGGPGPYRGDLFSHPVEFDAHRHVSQNYLALVAALLPSIPPPARVPTVAPRRGTARERAAVRAKLAMRIGAAAHGPLLLVNANASDMLPQRRWPADRFAALIRLVLAEFPDVRVLLIGGDDDRATTAPLASEVGDARCVDVAGLFELGELPALFEASALMVSNDSGPAHFAAVGALPVVALFGPETPALFRPLGDATVISAGLACSPCVNVSNQRRTRCIDNQCMKRIAVADVFAATRAVLAPGRGRVIAGSDA